VKRHLPAARIVAVEKSAAALAVAQRNALKLGLDVEFRHGLWFEAGAGEHFDAVVSNPPYVCEDDPHLFEGDVRFEPRSALVAGPDGLESIRAIVAGAAAHLRPGGRLLVEHGLGQDAAVRRLLGEAGLEDIATWPDLAGIARVSGGGLKS
jgi:release factor glutamine methyltransferase